MNKTIITVQHTQSQHHLNGMIGAWCDWELTEQGKEQAGKIGEWLETRVKSHKFVMFISDLKRAVQTATEINKYLHIMPIFTERIREINAGDGNGKSNLWYNENKTPYPIYYDPDYKPFANADSDRTLWKRIYPFYQELLKCEHENIIVVSHGTTLSFLQSMLFNDTFKIYPEEDLSASPALFQNFILTQQVKPY